MKFQEIDRLAQSVDKLPDIANLGDRYAYHCLREIYDRYLAGKLGKEETEAAVSYTHLTLPTMRNV